MNTYLKPNTFIAGVPKGGTTALAAILQQHPDIFIPNIKEPRYFILSDTEIDGNDPVNQGAINKLEKYQNLYSTQEKSKVSIDATPAYFSSERAIPHIHQFNPKSKIIILLRDPVERAFSHFIFSQRQGYEPMDIEFEDILERKEITLKSGFIRKRSYLEIGYYGMHIENLLKHFDISQIYIETTETFQNNTKTVLEQIANFLELPEYNFEIQKEHYAKSGLPKSKVLHTLLNQNPRIKNFIPPKIKAGLKKAKAKIENKNLEKPKINEETRAKLIDHYLPQMEILKKTIALNTSSWPNFS